MTDDTQDPNTDFVDAAARFAEFVAPKVTLDGSRASLDAVDGLLGEMHASGQEIPEPVWYDVSAYINEVARREFGGRYVRVDEQDPVALVIGEPEFGVLVRTMSKVRGRVTNGDEDNIPFFYDGIAPLVARKANATLV